MAEPMIDFNMKKKNVPIYKCTRTVAALLLAGLAMTATAQNTVPTKSELFRPPIVLDAHVDILLNLMNPKNNRSLDEPGWHGQANFENWKSGGTNAVFFAVWVDPRQFRGDKAISRVEQMIGVLHQQIQLYPSRLELCDMTDEVRKTIASGRTAALIGIEGGVAINDDLANIARYRQAGVRYMTLTWRGNLSWAGSSQDLKNPFRRGEEMLLTDSPSPGGLTEFGRRVVAEMNRVGMVVDLSHVSDETFFDAIKASNRPVMVSHSNARALSDHKRNVSDDMLRALKTNGGVIGLNLWAELLEPTGKGSKTPGAQKITMDTVLDMIDHMVKVAGIESVGNDPITVYGDGSQSRAFADVEDVVRGLMGLLNSPEAAGNVYNVGNNEEISIAELASLIIEKTGSKSTLEFISFEKAYDEKFEDLVRRVPDLSKIQALTGYKPTRNIQQITERVINWTRAEAGR